MSRKWCPLTPLRPPSTIAADHLLRGFGFHLLTLDISMIMLTHLAMMLSAVSGWRLPPSDGSAQGSPLSLVNQSEITDGVVLAHDRRGLFFSDWFTNWFTNSNLCIGRHCDIWSVSPLVASPVKIAPEILLWPRRNAALVMYPLFFQSCDQDCDQCPECPDGQVGAAEQVICGPHA